MTNSNVDIALLKRVYENAAVMALKRRFDAVDSSGTGILRRADFTRSYHQLCPWDDRMMTKTNLVGEFDQIANGSQEISFMTFLIAVTMRHPKALLPEHVVTFLNGKIEQAIAENPLMASEREALRRAEVTALLKSLYTSLDSPSFAAGINLGTPLLAPSAKGHGLRLSQERLRPAVDPRLGPTMGVQSSHFLSTSILSTGMLPLDVEIEVMERELQALPYEVLSRNGETKQTEPLILYHAQEMNADHITFETPAQLATVLALICELEQLQEGEEMIWEEKSRTSDIPGAAYQYLMLLQCDSLTELDSTEDLGSQTITSLDAIVIPLSEAVCASNLCVGIQDLVSFYRDAETALAAMIVSVTAQEQKARQKSVSGSLGSHCFRHIRQMEHEEAVFESPASLVAALRLLTELPEPDASVVEEKLQRWSLLENAKKYIREKSQLQFAKAQVVKMILEAVMAAITGSHLVKPTATDAEAFDIALTRVIQESRQLDDKNIQAVTETGNQLRANYLRLVHRMESALEKEFSTFAQVALALNLLCTPNVKPEVLTFSTLSEPVKRFIEKADKTVVRSLPPTLVEPAEKERTLGFDMLVNNYWAVSAQVDAGINGVRELVRVMSRLYSQNKLAPPQNGTLFKGRQITPGKVGTDDAKTKDEDDENWSINDAECDHMPTYKRAVEISRIGFDSAIKSHFRFMKSVNARVIAPLQSFLDNQYLNKRKMDEEIRKLDAQMRQSRLVLNEEQRNCEIAFSNLKGKKDVNAKKRDKLGRAKVASMFKTYEANVFQLARHENMIKQSEIAVRLRQLEEMERHRQATVQTQVDKLASLYRAYVSELQEHDENLSLCVDKLKNNNDFTNAVRQWLREGGGSDPIAYRLPCRPEQILTSEVGESDERGEGGTGMDWLSNGSASDLHSGSLKKRNQANNIWASRYFILRLEPDRKKYTLNYYHSLEDAAKRHILPEVIPLDQVEYVVTTLNKKQRNPEDNYRFDLKLRPGGRSLERAELCLRADTKEQCLVWVARLQEAGVTVKDELFSTNSPLESPETENELTNAQLTTKILTEGSIKKKSTSRHGHIWLSRYFVLRSNNVLYYYDGPSDAKHFRNPRWLKTEDIAEIHIGESGKGAQEGVRLNLTMRNSLRTFDLLATDPDNCQEWYRQLTAVIHVESAPTPDYYGGGRVSVSSSRSAPTPPTSESKKLMHSSQSPRSLPQKILPPLNQAPGSAPRVPPSMRVADHSSPRAPSEEPPEKRKLGLMTPAKAEEPRKSFTSGLRDSVVAVQRLALRHSKTPGSKGEAVEEFMTLDEMSAEDVSLAQQFERCLGPVIKNRLQLSKARNVKDCFSGKDAITAMITANLGRDRKEALEIGNRLLRMNMFFSVDKSTTEFKDSDKSLYRLERDGGDARMSLTGTYERSVFEEKGYGSPDNSTNERLEGEPKFSALKKNPPPPPPSSSTPHPSSTSPPPSTAAAAAAAVAAVHRGHIPPPPSSQATPLRNGVNGALPVAGGGTPSGHGPSMIRPVHVASIKPALERATSDTSFPSTSSQSASSIGNRQFGSESTLEHKSDPSSTNSDNKDDVPTTPEAREQGIHRPLRFSMTEVTRADDDFPVARLPVYECVSCGEKLDSAEDMCFLCGQNSLADGGAELVIQTE